MNNEFTNVQQFLDYVESLGFELLIPYIYKGTDYSIPLIKTKKTVNEKLQNELKYYLHKFRKELINILSIKNKEDKIMNTISITTNGKTVFIQGGNISVHNGVITVDGNTIDIGGRCGQQVIIHGDCGSIACDGSVEVKGAITGNIDCGGSCQCGDVTGDIEAGGSVQASNAGGSIDAGGSVHISKH